MIIVGTGQDGFSVLFETSQDVILCGIAIFLPHAQENRQTYERLKICLNLLQHGVSQIGPCGPEMASIYHGLSKTEVVEWSGPKGCARSNGSKSSLHCLPGPWMMNGGRTTIFNQSFECKGIHPYPLFFSSSQPLISGVKYLLSLRLLFTINGQDLEIPVETIWGFQGTVFENQPKNTDFWRENSIVFNLKVKRFLAPKIRQLSNFWRENSIVFNIEIKRFLRQKSVKSGNFGEK